MWWRVARGGLRTLGGPILKGLSFLLLIRFVRRHFLNLSEFAQRTVYCIYTILVATLINMVVFAWFLKKDPLVILRPNIHDPNFTFFLLIFLLTIPLVAIVMHGFLFRGVGGMAKDTTVDLVVQPTKKKIIKPLASGMKKTVDHGRRYAEPTAKKAWGITKTIGRKTLDAIKKTATSSTDLITKSASYIRQRGKKVKSDKGSRWKFLKLGRKR